MKVKDVAQQAIVHIAEIFESEQPENIGLEEISFNENEKIWEVTIGFSRPWDHQKPGLLSGLQGLLPARHYKYSKNRRHNRRRKIHYDT